MGTIDGIRHIVNDDFNLFYIDNFSEMFKCKIREHLSMICHGSAYAATDYEIYCYNRTINEFLKRCNNEHNDTYKMGIIAEFIFHIILIEYLHDYTINSPFFNTSDRGNKKGFDVLLTKNGLKEICLAEVKSGEKGMCPNNTKKIISLIEIAKNDLKKRLNEGKTSLWLNAINCANIAISENNKDEKKAVMDILYGYSAKADSGNLFGTDLNVILVGVLFNELDTEINEKVLSNKKNNIVNENIFKETNIVAIQKETFSAVLSFLLEESEKK